MEQFISLLVGVIIGWATGIPLGFYLSGQKVEINLRVFAGFLVLILWVTYELVSIISGTLEVPLEVRGIAGGVITALFGEEVFKK